MFTQATLTDNIRNFFSKATDAEFVAGKNWYGEAHAIAANMAQNSRFTLAQSAAIIAILSPRMSWSRNVELAHYFVATESVTMPNGKQIHTKQQIAKLQAVASGSDIETAICRNYGKMGRGGVVIKAGLPSKTLNFYWNILAGNSMHVTVDAHAAGAALNSFAGYDERGILAVRHYELIASAYKAVAMETGLQASQVQAVVWLVYRRILDSVR
ncbi:hypothetical protein KC887_04325 [Candidatus Kaiserbacteria bacterium]|nr:hypothetical protein [Candidatus Kaiserbacteria bacterium]